MLVILGIIVVLGSVLAGFTMAGGHVGALIHLSEFVTIGGASLGGFIIMAPKRVLIDTIKGVLHCIKGSPFNKRAYMDLFQLYFELGKIARRDGLLALDSHIGDPHQSTVFKEFPKILGNKHLTHFIVSALGMLSESKDDSSQLRSQLEAEIGVIEHEHHDAVNALTKTADALPGFGIVAAVLGIVITMGHIDGPASEIGHKVGAALVGTFLGILLSYGFFAPMSGRMELLGAEEVAFFRTITNLTVGMYEGISPKNMVVQASRGVGTEFRPSSNDMKQIFKEA